MSEAMNQPIGYATCSRPVTTPRCRADTASAVYVVPSAPSGAAKLNASVLNIVSDTTS